MCIREILSKILKLNNKIDQFHNNIMKYEILKLNSKII